MKAGSKGQRHDPLLTFEQLLIGVDSVVSKGFCVCVRVGALLKPIKFLTPEKYILMLHFYRL